MRSARVLFFIIGFLSFLFFLNPQLAFAQTPTNYPSTNSTTKSLATPNMDPNVPRNQHTLAQSVTIEVLSALMCQLTGIDPVDSDLPCLGVNPQTKRLGYAPKAESLNERSKTGGLIGTASDMIAFTYQPIITTGIYTRYLSDNFGITKKVYAQEASYGFNGLKPIFNLWISVRNIAYALLVFAFVFIGIGIMLRIKIDPRTVMTIQNQIPKVIVSIILITFSYAIAAVMIDLMWVSTYAGVTMITTSSAEARNIDTGRGETLESKGTRQLLEIPLVYVNNVFHTGDDGDDNAGIFHITNMVANSIGSIISDITRSILGVDADEDCFDAGLLSGIDINLNACVANVVGFLAKLVANLIIFVVLLIALFKIWFNLLKAYIYSLFYVIISPIYIIFGLIPSKPLGFEKWLRAFFANIAVFPLTAFLFVGARVLMDTYNTGAPTQYIPPLIGHNAGANFGAFLAFGAIMIAPSLQKILQDKLGAKGIGTPGLVAAGVAAGAAVVGAPVGRAMKHLNRVDSKGQAVGLLARGKKETGNKALGAAAKLKVPFTKSALDKRLYMQKGDEHGYHSLHGYEAGKGLKAEGLSDMAGEEAYKERYSYRQRRRDRKKLKKSKP